MYVFDQAFLNSELIVFVLVLAPEVLAGRCPAPCNPCIKDQIRKVMSQLSQKYPREFQQMMASLTRRG